MYVIEIILITQTVPTFATITASSVGILNSA